MSRLDSAWVPAAIVLVVGLLLAGAGPMNGDAAVYQHQAATGALADRWTHAAYVALLALFSGVSWAADVANAVFGAVAVGLLGSRLADERGSRFLAGLVLAALVVPLAPFGEVDTLWLALLGVGLADSVGVAALGLGLAVAVSPSALAAIPWIVMKHRDYRWIGVLVAVLALTVVSQGAWWTGTRGVLTGGWSPGPLRHVGWLVVPALMSVRSLRPVDALALFGLLAPGDVPGHWIAVLPCLAGVSRASDRRWWAAVGVLCGLGLQRTFTTHARIVEETERVEAIATRITETGQVVGPWSWGVRVGLKATGDPYGVPFGRDRLVCEGERVFVPLGTWESCDVKPGPPR